MLRYLRPLLVSTTILLTIPATRAQSLTGDVTVRLNAGIDSANGRPMQTVTGKVVDATNPDIAPGSMAALSLLRTPQGFVVRLTRLMAGGQPTPVSSMRADPVNSRDGNVISSERVLLAPGSDVRFTLPGGASTARPNVSRPFAKADAPLPAQPPGFSADHWTAFQAPAGAVPDAACLVADRLSTNRLSTSLRCFRWAATSVAIKRCRYCVSISRLPLT